MNAREGRLARLVKRRHEMYRQMVERGEAAERLARLVLAADTAKSDESGDVWRLTYRAPDWGALKAEARRVLGERSAS